LCSSQGLLILTNGGILNRREEKNFIGCGFRFGHRRLLESDRAFYFRTLLAGLVTDNDPSGNWRSAPAAARGSPLSVPRKMPLRISTGQPAVHVTKTRHRIRVSAYGRSENHNR
jgi:hypothetical protein